LKKCYWFSKSSNDGVLPVTDCTALCVATNLSLLLYLAFFLSAKWLLEIGGFVLSVQRCEHWKWLDLIYELDKFSTRFPARKVIGYLLLNFCQYYRVASFMTRNLFTWIYWIIASKFMSISEIFYDSKSVDNKFGSRCILYWLVSLCKLDVYLCVFYTTAWGFICAFLRGRRFERNLLVAIVPLYLLYNLWKYIVVFWSWGWRFKEHQQVSPEFNLLFV